MHNKMRIQLTMAVLLSVAGLVLIFCAFWIDPPGEIHQSVLVAFGEISTFAGALFGVDYTYKLKEELREYERKKESGQHRQGAAE